MPEPIPPSEPITSPPESTDLPPLPKTQEELRDLIAKEQGKVLVAVQDKLGNLLVSSITNDFLRSRENPDPDIPSLEEDHQDLLQDLQGLQSTLTNVLNIVDKGGLPPESNKDPKRPQIDLEPETYQNTKSAANTDPIE